MNPFRSAGQWLVSLLPDNPSEVMVGAAVMGGIWLVIVGMLCVAGVLAWLIERRP